MYTDTAISKFDVGERLKLVEAAVKNETKGGRRDLECVNSVNMSCSDFSDGAGHIALDVDRDFKEGSNVVFDVAAEHVNNLSIVLNSRTANDVKVTVTIHNVIDIRRFSSLKKLIIITGFVIRFVNNLKGTLKNDNTNVLLENTLTIDEYKNALNLWIKAEQEILQRQNDFGKLKVSLKLFVDTLGLLRLKGQFENAALDYDEKHPLILRSLENSFFTKLIILDSHERVLHHGIETTQSDVRSNFWIVKGRKAAKSVLRKCVTCRRYQGRPLLPPETPDLPDYRVNTLYAFQCTGLDYAGPLFIKSNTDTSLKVYILMFTCASSRALHLELTPDMKALVFVRAFERFTARRGTPDVVVNDNFKTFKLSVVKKFMLCLGVRQKFILPTSPWWGRFYERLVRSVKISLKKILGKSMLSYEELQTVLLKIESVINGRPLVYLSEDDLGDVLTPNHLMYDRNIRKKSNALVPESVVQDLSKRYKYISKLVNDQWKRFSRVYLNELRQHHINRKEKHSKNNVLNVGDIVLIKDEEKVPRTQWRIGKIKRLVFGKDAQVRGAELVVISKTGEKTVYKRRVQKLIPVEITTDNHEPSINEPVKDSKRADETPILNSRRPTRKAKEEGQYL